jgi:hypothetical protein
VGRGADPRPIGRSRRVSSSPSSSEDAVGWANESLRGRRDGGDRRGLVAFVTLAFAWLDTPSLCPCGKR